MQALTSDIGQRSLSSVRSLLLAVSRCAEVSVAIVVRGPAVANCASSGGPQ